MLKSLWMKSNVGHDIPPVALTARARQICIKIFFDVVNHSLWTACGSHKIIEKREKMQFWQKMEINILEK